MPISVPSQTTNATGILVHLEMAPSRNVYLPSSLLTRVYVSTADIASRQLVIPLGVALFQRNLPIDIVWSGVPLFNDAVGLYHADVEWEGAAGKAELQAFAYNINGAEVGSAYMQLFLDRYNP